MPSWTTGLADRIGFLEIIPKRRRLTAAGRKEFTWQDCGDLVITRRQLPAQLTWYRTISTSTCRQKLADIAEQDKARPIPVASSLYTSDTNPARHLATTQAVHYQLRRGWPGRAQAHTQPQEDPVPAASDIRRLATTAWNRTLVTTLTMS
jgi:hypothetical protein